MNSFHLVCEYYSIIYKSVLTRHSVEERCQVGRLGKNLREVGWQGRSRMELNQLLSFFEIVKTGSFSKASENVYRSPSALSHQITKLEKELKIKLFERLGKTVKLREEGKMLYDVIGTFVNDLENLKKIYEDIRDCVCGSLTITATSGVTRYVLPAIIAKFMDQYPKIKCKLITSHITCEIHSMVSDDHVDLGIGPNPSQPCPQDLVFLFWKSFDRILLVARNHPLAKKRRIELPEIAKYPLVLPRGGITIRKNIEETFVQEKVSYEIAMEMDIVENIKKYVEMGFGPSILSSLCITPEDKKTFALFNVNHVFGRGDYGIYLRRGKYVSAAMKQFITLFAPELLVKLPPHTPLPLSNAMTVGSIRHKG
jgi:LysR family cys regulon transcriptional activator